MSTNFRRGYCDKKNGRNGYSSHIFADSAFSAGACANRNDLVDTLPDYCTVDPLPYSKGTSKAVSSKQ